MNWHVLPEKKIFELLDSSRKGITSTRSEQLLAEYGPNVLEEARKKPLWKMFLRQFTDFMILVLVAAAVVAGVVGDITDTIVILVIILTNAVIGFVQEYRAEKAMDALKKMAANTATVVRDGETVQVEAAQLVPGDVLLLEAGNVVPADTRLFEVHTLQVAESSLTGESHPVDKDQASLSKENIPLGDRINMVYKGTNITHGRATGIVVATGMNTELGNIARMLQEEDTETPLQKRLTKFGKTLSFIILLICAAYFTVGYLRGEPPLLMLLTAISLAVAAIPEALPAVITIALSMGANRMVRNKALVRKLPAVETLGSVNYICTDKTGTLTENKMTVQEIWAGGETIPATDLAAHVEEEQINWLLHAMALCNDVEPGKKEGPIGDPTEIAIAQIAVKNHFVKKELEKKWPRVGEIPFDSDRKCMTTLHKNKSGVVAFTKGALDVLLDKTEGLSASEKRKWMEWGDKMAEQGLRVLGFAMRELPKMPADITPKAIEHKLTLLGIVGLIDPPRKEAQKAIHECKTAGIKTVMITGDYMLTAKNIATQLGILESEDDLIVTGTELEAMSSATFKKKWNTSGYMPAFRPNKNWAS